MNYLIIFTGVVLGLIMLFVSNFIVKDTKKQDSRAVKMVSAVLKIVRLLPVIVLAIMLLVIVVYLKTKFYVRVSHAWLVLQFWLFSTIFYAAFILLRHIKKSLMAISMMAMMISAWIAIYLTPLNHYETMFDRTNIVLLNILGLVMLGIMYFSNTVIRKKL